MSRSDPPFTVGIQEEYLLVKRDSRDVDADPPAALLEECAKRSGGQVSPRFLRSQLEASTRPCRTLTEAAGDLARLRSIISEVAARFGRAPIAASTHPFAKATRQITTEREQFFALAKEMQGAARRIMICGMRVHVGIDDDDLRVDLMNQMTYFVPHLLALSCSSPFWDGERTGLMSFRMTLMSSLPRTGLPERFASYADLRRNLDMLVRNGMIEHEGKMWWDVRPASLHPTLETRVMDCCTRIDDAASVTALTLSLIRCLYRLKLENRSWRLYPNTLIAENRWRAMRYSVDGQLLDLARGELIAFPQLVAELIALLREDATALGCLRELEHLQAIATGGTSAHRQIKAYEQARSEGASGREALQAVVDLLIKETHAGLGAKPE